MSGVVAVQCPLSIRWALHEQLHSFLFRESRCFDLSDGGVVDIADQSIEEEMEVLPTSRPSKVVMVRSNAEEIIH